MDEKMSIYRRLFAPDKYYWLTEKCNFRFVRLADCCQKSANVGRLSCVKIAKSMLKRQ
jgi:hypothetical protein